LLIEWPKGERDPTKYQLATLPGTIVFAEVRWRIERDDQELKQELGLPHYDGRGWHGFHHAATLCTDANRSPISERGRILIPAPCAAANVQKSPFLSVADPGVPTTQPESQIMNSIDVRAAMRDSCHRKAPTSSTK
jgi:hypothetical protein